MNEKQKMIKEIRDSLNGMTVVQLSNVKQYIHNLTNGVSDTPNKLIPMNDTISDVKYDTNTLVNEIVSNEIYDLPDNTETMKSTPVQLTIPEKKAPINNDSQIIKIISNEDENKIMSNIHLTDEMKKEFINLHKCNYKLKDWIIDLINMVGESLIKYDYIGNLEWINYKLIDATITNLETSDDLNNYIYENKLSISSIDNGSFMAIKCMFQKENSSIIEVHDILSLDTETKNVSEYVIII